MVALREAYRTPDSVEVVRHSFNDHGYFLPRGIVEQAAAMYFAQQMAHDGTPLDPKERMAKAEHYAKIANREVANVYKKGANRNSAVLHVARQELSKDDTQFRAIGSGDKASYFLGLCKELHDHLKINQEAGYDQGHRSYVPETLVLHNATVPVDITPEDLFAFAYISPFESYHRPVRRMRSWEGSAMLFAGDDLTHTLSNSLTRDGNAHYHIDLYGNHVRGDEDFILEVGGLSSPTRDRAKVAWYLVREDGTSERDVVPVHRSDISLVIDQIFADKEARGVLVGAPS